MKKLFTSVALALALMSASAENYTCPLAINISGSVDKIGRASCRERV